MSPSSVGSRALRVLVVATSLGRTSGGGLAFLDGLVGSLSRSEGLALAVAGPARLVAERWATGEGTPEIIDVPEVVGLGRIALDVYAVAQARRWNADVVHYPHEWCPPSSRPVVVTLQNIRAFHPQSAPGMGARGTAIRRLAGATAGRAAAIVAVSSTAASTWNRVVPHARATDLIPEGFTPPLRRLAGALDEISDYRDLTPGYVLAITGPAGYKNPHLTLEAMRQHTARDTSARWVIAGVAPGEWHDRIRRRGVGVVERDDLLVLMRHARSVVFLSEVESFGLPALESLCMGTQPIVLKGTAMEEWLGAACCPVAPRVEEILAAVEWRHKRSGTSVLQNSVLKSRFHWDRIAESYAAVYRRIT